MTSAGESASVLPDLLSLWKHSGPLTCRLPSVVSVTCGNCSLKTLNGKFQKEKYSYVINCPSFYYSISLELFYYLSLLFICCASFMNEISSYYVYIGKEHSICRVWYSPRFQASTGGLGMYLVQTQRTIIVNTQ